ncbi:lipoyl(octanoyl) transferase [Gammaproteobacteria bacterium]
MELIEPVVRRLGKCDYLPTWEAMRQFTAVRTSQTLDEIWLLEHPPTYTLGQASRSEHLLAPGSIPVIQTDRGGQVTYHGPGQIVAYTLLDITRRGLGVRQLVNILEQTVVNLLADYGIVAHTRLDAPGVYVETAKIAFLGLRIRRGRAYHGLSLNVAMDLSPFSRINPCGYPDLPITQLSDLGGPENLMEVAAALATHLFKIGVRS